MPRNNAKKWAVISLGITLLGVLMVAAGMILDDYDSMWLLAVGLLLGITFLICFFIFLGQARRLDRLLKREELLAYWAFDPAQQLQKAGEEYQARKRTNKILLIIVTIFFVVISGLFTGFGFDDPEDAAGFLLIMGSILALIFLAALVAPGAAYRKMIRSAPEVYIGPLGAWVMGEYVQWKAPLTRPRRVAFEQSASGVRIAVDYEIRQRYGYQQQTCRIPVPLGREQEAYSAAMNIAGINQVEFVAETV